MSQPLRGQSKWSKARCDLTRLPDVNDGLKWYECGACGRRFTEAHPTIVPSICLNGAAPSSPNDADSDVSATGSGPTQVSHEEGGR